jgi:hypothetical protein
MLDEEFPRGVAKLLQFIGKIKIHGLLPVRPGFRRQIF